MTESEARALMALPKWGDPNSQWTQQKTRQGMVINAFGVTDKQGAVIAGLQVEFSVYRPPRLALERYTFTMFRYEMGTLARAYQLDINPRRGLRPTDHAYSHEHIGHLRVTADPAWSNLNFLAAVARFLTMCNLTLAEPLPDIDAFDLK